MSSCCGGSSRPQKRTQTFWVTGMTCNHCVGTIEKAVGKIQGVEEVNVSLDSGTVIVQGTDVSKESVTDAIRSAGYEVK